MAGRRRLFYRILSIDAIWNDGTLSTKFDLERCVSHGSCLGPLLFVVYASKIFEIVDKHNLEIHCYADDIANFIYPSVLIILQIKRLPWLGLEGVLRTFVTGC